jgi:hypothetical protein
MSNIDDILAFNRKVVVLGFVIDSVTGELTEV